MLKVNIHDAKTHLSKLAEQAGAGEEIIIAKAGRPIARLVPLAQGPAVRRKGLLKGKIKISDDFDKPLPDDVVDLFEGRGES
jgi:prevent-host-death family protein